jgi:Flp pilus assembly protein TadG
MKRKRHGAKRVNDGYSIIDNKTRCIKNRQRGQAMIEMAIVLPVLIIVLLGIIEVGRFADLAIVVASSARAGAIYGAQNLAAAVDQTGIQTAAQNDAKLGTFNSTSGTGLYVNSWSELLPSAAPPPLNSGPPCTIISDTDTPVPYVIVQTRYTAKSLFSSKTLTFNGCAQMQVAQ